MSTAPVVTLDTTYHPTRFPDWAANTHRFDFTNTRIAQVNFKDVDNNLIPTYDVTAAFRPGTLVMCAVSLKVWRYGIRHVCIFCSPLKTIRLNIPLQTYQLSINSLRILDDSWIPAHDEAIEIPAPVTPSPKKRTRPIDDLDVSDKKGKGAAKYVLRFLYLITPAHAFQLGPSSLIHSNPFVNVLPFHASPAALLFIYSSLDAHDDCHDCHLFTFVPSLQRFPLPVVY